MNTTPSCCQQLLTIRHPQWPFSRLIALDYYDGPTEGVIQCGACSTDYWFQMIDLDLYCGEMQDARVFSFAPLPPGSLDELAEACRDLGPPGRPTWVPIWKFPSAAAQKAAEEQVDKILSQASAPEFVVACMDWTEFGDPILAAGRLAADDLPEVQSWVSSPGPSGTRDWFDFLGIPRHTAPLEAQDES